MSNEMVKVETGNHALTAQSVMEELGISASDLAIPKLHLMQSTSERVGMGQAALGDLVNSLTGEKVGDFNTPCEFLPIKVQKSWVIFDINSGTPKFLRIEPVTAQNEKAPWEEVIDGVKIRRDMSLDFYVVLIKDIEAGEAFPYMISFRRTSYSSGRALATHITKLAFLQKEMFSRVVCLKPERQKTDTNVYAVFSIQTGRPATEAEKASAKMWLALVKTNQYKADDSDIVEPVVVAAPVEKPAVVVGKKGKSANDIY